MGRILTDGVFTDVNFSRPANAVYNTSGLVTYPLLTAEDYLEYAVTIAITETGTLLSRFPKIDQTTGEYFNFTIQNAEEFFQFADQTNGVWRGGGLYLPKTFFEKTLFLISEPKGFLYGFFFYQNLADKVTMSFDYDADEVTFTPGQRDAYFLMPKIKIWTVQASYNNPSARFEWLIADWRPIPRIPVLTVSNPYFHFGGNLGNAVFDPAWVSDYPDDGNYYQSVRQMIDFIKIYGINPAAKKLSHNTTTGSYDITDMSLASYPDPTFFPPTVPPTNVSYRSIRVNELTVDTPPRTFKGIVKQSGNFFYVWQREV